VWAAIGQVKLMSSYQFLFGKYNIAAGQVLATKESFRDRMHYLNMKNCISAMLNNKVIPIVNENDTIAIDELMFTDNDELSGLMAAMMDCSALIILSNVDGIYSGDPSDEGSELIREVDPQTDELNKYIRSSKSGFGRGGMKTKYSNAAKIASEGISVFIANGNRDGIILDIVRGKDVPSTHFLASRRKESGVRKWISHSETFAKGSVTINDGAREALTGNRASSLLMIGVTAVEGQFERGDIVTILDKNKKNLGLGKAQFDSRKALQNIGAKMNTPFIKYDYMVININSNKQ
jgi:glutamate 5-kinase